MFVISLLCGWGDLKKISLCIYLLAAPGLHYCMGFSLVLQSGGYSLVHGLIMAVAYLVAEYRLNSCGTQVQLPCGMWDLSEPGIEPMSPGHGSTTEPPAKPWGDFSLMQQQISYTMDGFLPSIFSVLAFKDSYWTVDFLCGWVG